jgi:hypothetical protein
MRFDPVSRSLVAIDIEGYSRRKNEGHLELRDALRGVRDEAFARTDVTISPDEVQDQGDAFLVLVRPEVPKPRLVDDLVREFGTALRRFNRCRLPSERMRLRIALHAGEVHLDGTGFGGEAVITVMRLIEADALRTALKKAPNDIAVIVSEQLHHDVVLQCYRSTDPAEYWRVDVAHKTFRQAAWIRVPGGPAGRPADDVAADAPAQPGSGRHDRPGRPPTTGGTPDPQPSIPGGGVYFGGTANISGPTSFGHGHVAGRDVNLREEPPRRQGDA